MRLLKASVVTRENKFQFGSAIDSQRLGDIKKRFWFRGQEAFQTPSMAVLLLIDGSGSMAGKRCESAMKSSIILHEVLKKQGIAHCSY